MFLKTNTKRRKARHLLAAGVVAAACVVATGSAKAALMDVKEIVITNANAGVPPDLGWLQISEVVALDGSNVDQALAATASAMAVSTGFGTTTAPAIDGIGPAAFPAIYHSDSPDVGEALTITFGTAFELVALSIFGRAAGFSYRDIYDVEIFNSAGDSIFTALSQSADNNANEAVISLDSIAPVPVPAALPLLAGGLGLLGFMGWRRKRKASAA